MAQKPLTRDALAGLPACKEYRVGEQIFVRPRSLHELFAARARFPDALLLAGGTDLGLRVSKGRESIPAVIAVDAVQELREIRTSAGALELGGAVTYTEALAFLDRHFPSFSALVRRIGSRQIRNLGTVAGNLATASPIGDTLPCLIALGADVTLASSSGERSMPVESFITGYRQTALLPGEVIRAVRIPFLQDGQQFAAYKLSKRFDQDIATVIGAFLLERRNGVVSQFRAAYGGMAPCPMRAASVEAAVNGKPWIQERMAHIDAAVARDFTPITDHRGGAAYRLRAAANLLRRFQWETSSRIPLRLEAL
jgi:xanthine dehydrogenase small subunit